MIIIIYENAMIIKYIIDFIKHIISSKFHHLFIITESFSLFLELNKEFLLIMFLILDLFVFLNLIN